MADASLVPPAGEVGVLVFLLLPLWVLLSPPSPPSSQKADPYGLHPGFPLCAISGRHRPGAWGGPWRPARLSRRPRPVSAGQCYGQWLYFSEAIAQATSLQRNLQASPALTAGHLGSFSQTGKQDPERVNPLPGT